jgi:hypothetical protein
MNLSNEVVFGLKAMFILFELRTELRIVAVTYSCECRVYFYFRWAVIPSYIAYIFWLGLGHSFIIVLFLSHVLETLSDVTTTCAFPWSCNQFTCIRIACFLNSLLFLNFTQLHICETSNLVNFVTLYYLILISRIGLFHLIPLYASVLWICPSCRYARRTVRYRSCICLQEGMQLRTPM